MTQLDSQINELLTRTRRLERMVETQVARQESVEKLSRSVERLARAVSELREPGRRGGPRKRLLSNRLREAYRIARDARLITPGQLAATMGLRPNTCSEYLNELVARGYLRKVAHGTYAAEEAEKNAV